VTTVHVTQVVNKATPVVSWSPAPLQIGSKLTSAQLDATANVPGKFVYTPALGTEITGSAETLKVVFTPTDSTDYNSVTQTVSLEVTVVSVSPLSLNFGTVYLDSITTKDVTVTNLGSVPVNVSTPLISILTDGDSREFVAVNLCLLPLQPHKSCTIQVSYVAGPFYRQQSAAMSVRFNSAGSPQTVSLTALTIDPETSLSATSLSFGTQKEGTSSASKTITLTNPGATALTIDSVTIGGSDPHDFLLANHCGSSLQAGSSCTFGITFKPGAKGSRSAKLTIQDNAKVGSQTVALSGAGD
jgi:archaellum component FlaF (FlaF/FlaG flagellin family)